MSGPKLIELRRMQAARERQRNHDRCAAFGSEYARRLEEYHQWGAKLRALGVAAEDVMQPLERVRTEIDNLLRQESHHEAARIFSEQVSRLHGELENRRQKFQERLVDLQNRHRQLRRDGAAVAANSNLLRERLKTTMPEGWPENEQTRIRNLIEQALAKIAIMETPAFPNDAKSAAHFEQAEAAAQAALMILQVAQQQFETELNATHQRLMLDSLGSQNTASTSLTEVLKRLPNRGASWKPATADILSAKITGAESPHVRQDPTPATSAFSSEMQSEIEKLCADLAVAGDEQFLAETRERTKEIDAEQDSDRRRLLTESLLIDGGVRLKELRELARRREEIQKLIDSTAHVKDAVVDAIVAELRLLISSESKKEIGLIGQRLRESLIAAEAKREREFRRKALIDSLQELGYETDENLETAFVKEGKIVLRRSGEEDYAVEMVADSELSRLQTALVRYADSEEMTAQQRRRDFEKEEAWCENHARLRQKMAARGLETPLKMQLKPGEHPVKVVVGKNRAENSRSAQADKERFRKM